MLLEYVMLRGVNDRPQDAQVGNLRDCKSAHAEQDGMVLHGCQSMHESYSFSLWMHGWPYATQLSLAKHDCSCTCRDMGALIELHCAAGAAGTDSKHQLQGQPHPVQSSSWQSFSAIAHPGCVGLQVNILCSA